MPDPPTFVSMINLIATPERYHDLRVGVIGYCCFAFERMAVYLHEADYHAGVSKNGLWLTAERDDLALLHEKVCLIWGVFDQEHKGHLGMFSGSIRDIDRLQEWRR